MVRKSSSLFDPLTFFRKSKASRESSIFYIYSNPLPVGLREEEQQEEKQQQQQQEEQEEHREHREHQELPDPPLFYVRL